LEYPAHAFVPIEIADIAQTSVFTREWDRLGLQDKDLRVLEIMIMANPKGNPVVRGTRDLRKIRFSPAGYSRGKSGALRACYVYFPLYSLILLVAVYPKGAKDDLTRDDIKIINQLIERQETELSKGPVM